MTAPKRPEFDLAAWVKASRAAQGLPEHIEDPVTLDTVARLLLAAKTPVVEREISGGVAK